FRRALGGAVFDFRSPAQVGQFSGAVDNGLEDAAQKGRANLFVGVYMANRNRRAHKELPSKLSDELREFLLVNELFLLEAESKLRVQDK
ncbi:MAG: hypothetical protein LAT50_11610, partial [Ectothiorhodospiraceae bacterium]|nr:hypothetical protein [Ectothiorhodospiraceae bacterium]